MKWVWFLRKKSGFSRGSLCRVAGWRQLKLLSMSVRLIIRKQTKLGSKWDWKQTILTKFWALHIKNHHRMQQKSFSFWYIIWFLLNTQRFWWIFASKSKFRTMLVNSLLNLPNLLSNIDPLRFLFWDYCSKSGLNLAKMGLV